jgi:hypothetical protein
MVLPWPQAAFFLRLMQLTAEARDSLAIRPPTMKKTMLRSAALCQQACSKEVSFAAYEERVMLTFRLNCNTTSDKGYMSRVIDRI